MRNEKATPSKLQKRGRLKRIGLAFWLVVTILPILGVLFSLLSPISFYTTQEEYRQFAENFPVSGPILFVFFQILQVVVAPISHVAFGYMGGFLYGQYLGAVLNWTGRVIGHFAAFYIARRFGRRIVKRFVKDSTIAKYDKYVSNRYGFLFLAYFLPLFPDDELTYLSGLSKMRVRPFIIVNLLGQIGGSLGLAQLGSGIDTSQALFWIMAVATVLAFIIVLPLLRRMSKSNSDKP